MAVQSGTATNFADLYNKLRDFLTTTMTPSGERWTQIAGPVGVLTAADEIVLQGPGTSGTDEILVGITPFVNPGADYYNFGFKGLVTYNPAAGNIAAQVNGSSFYRTLHAWNDPMPYWIIANGRRFIVIVQVSTFFQGAYAGFILPFSLPTTWPYPLFIGGCSGGRETTRWSEQLGDRGMFFDPAQLGNNSQQSSAVLCIPDVTWQAVRNSYTNGDNNQNPQNGFNVDPWRFHTQPIRDNIDGTYTLEPAEIVTNTIYFAQMGRLQGVYRISGFNNAAGAIVTVGGVDHLVVPNIYRSAWSDFAAIALE